MNRLVKYPATILAATAVGAGTGDLGARLIDDPSHIWHQTAAEHRPAAVNPKSAAEMLAAFCLAGGVIVSLTNLD